MIHTSFTPEEISLIDLQVHSACTIDYTVCHTPAPLVTNHATCIDAVLLYMCDLESDQ